MTGPRLSVEGRRAGCPFVQRQPQGRGRTAGRAVRHPAAEGSCAKGHPDRSTGTKAPRQPKKAPSSAGATQAKTYPPAVGSTPAVLGLNAENATSPRNTAASTDTMAMRVFFGILPYSSAKAGLST